MKKILAVLAVLAVAAAAQAELLATWNTVGGAVTVESTTGGFSAGDLELYGSAKSTLPSTIFGVNTLKDGASGISFDVLVDSGFSIENAALNGDFTGAPTGPNTINVLVDDAARTSFVRGGQTGTFNVSLGSLGEVATVALVADPNGGTARSGSSETFTNNSATFAIATEMKLNGDVVQGGAVPEPATMSLLGLGALAMALRRKLRK